MDAIFGRRTRNDHGRAGRQARHRETQAAPGNAAQAHGTRTRTAHGRRRMNLLWLILGIIGAAALLLVLNHDAGTLFGVNNDDFGSMIYLSIWAVVVAAAVFSGRGRGAGRWREMARNAVLWLAIVLVLVAGLGSRSPTKLS